jgi:hypothetical protein
MFIRADGSVLRATNNEEQAIFNEAERTVWLLREASRTKNDTAQPLRQLDQNDDEDDGDAEDDEEEEEEEGDASEN